MSDILIKNMKMPKSCYECPIKHQSYSLKDDCTRPACFAMDEWIPDEDEKPDWCPIIEVPPHGRLIDADEMLQFLVDTFGEEVKAGFAWKTISEHCITIIEAEGT